MERLIEQTNNKQMDSQDLASSKAQFIPSLNLLLHFQLESVDTTVLILIATVGKFLVSIETEKKINVGFCNGSLETLYCKNI